MSILKALLNARLDLVVSLFGFVFVLLAFYEFSIEGKSVSSTFHSTPNLYFLAIGALGLGAPFALHASNLMTNVNAIGAIPESENGGFRFQQRATTVHVGFGKLESAVKNSKSTAVVLPANDLFNDACFEDGKTALGAYLNNHFTADERLALRKERNKQLATILDDATEENGKIYYGPGKCIFLESQGHQMIFAAVATERGGEGLKTYLVYIYEALGNIFRIVSNKRIDTVFFPLLGAGKGGVPKPVALAGLLSAIFEAASRPTGHHLKDVHVIVFERDGSSTLNKAEVRYVMATICRVWSGFSK